jgi:hypothetical protein
MLVKMRAIVPQRGCTESLARREKTDWSSVKASESPIGPGLDIVENE